MGKAIAIKSGTVQKENDCRRKYKPSSGNRRES